MTKHLFTLSLVLFVSMVLSTSPTNASVLNNINLIETRIDAHQLLVEAQVVNQYSFWSKDNLKILTANELFVYKIFKGQINSDYIVVITEGGELADAKQQVFPNLDLEMGQIGLFFLNQASEDKCNPKSSIEETLQFYPTHIQKSFLPYNLLKGEAKDLHRDYPSIQDDLYTKLEKCLKTTYVEMNTLPVLEKDSQDKTRGTDTKSTSNSMDIYCIYPQIISSGTGSVMTIYGNGFGTLGSSCKVEMKNPDTGGWQSTSITGDQILHWSDEYIEVILPTKVGSGPVTVTKSTGEVLASNFDITVSFSRATAGTSDPLPTMLVNDNGLGGYSLQYSTNSSNGGMSFANSGAIAPFQRAVNRVKNELGYNLSISSITTNVNTYGDDGVNAVMFDNNLAPIGSDAGQLFSQFKKCGDVWEVTGIDVVFKRQGTGNPALNWNFSVNAPSSDQLDFESVAMHELLHGAQLKHNMEPDALMYFAHTYGMERRTPMMCSDIAGVKHVLEESANYNPQCANVSVYQYPAGFAGFSGYDFDSCPQSYHCDGATPTVEMRAKARLFLEGPFNGLALNNDLFLNGLIPPNHPFNVAPWYYTGTESVGHQSNLPSNTVDWVLVELRSSQDIDLVVAQKAAFLNTDGELMNVDGSPGVLFDNSMDDEYYICVHHKTHLSVVASSPNSLSTSENYDFTRSRSTALGNEQLIEKVGRFTMYSGDYDGNGIINSIDYNLWITNNAAVGIYASWDGDGSGIINNLDYNLWTKNRGKVGVSCIQY